MIPPTDDTTEERSDRLTDWPDIERRPLLKALAVGATLSLGSGVGTAQYGGDVEDGGNDEAELDPEFGYPTTDATAVPEELAPDHEVQLLAAPPSGPDQPPFLYFEPTGLHVEPGDIVQFTAVTPDHTVTAYHPDIGPQRRVPEDAPGFSSPVMGPGAAWLYRFEHEGVYDMYCAPHHILGMTMRLVVGDLAEEDVPDYVETVEGVPSQEDIEGAINQLSEENEDCEWPFVMPADVLGTDVLDPTIIRGWGEVPFGAVAGELGYEFQPPGE